MAEVINPAFYAQANTRLDDMLESFYDATPAARYLASSSTVDKELFARHTIETILRLRLARTADSKVIQLFTRTNPFAAQKWCKYTQESMLYDRLYLKDLRHLGVNEETVYATAPMLSTQLLQGYLYYTIEHDGPRGLLAKAYFVEYLLRQTQAMWNDNIKAALGEQAVKGAEARVDDDYGDDRITEIWNVLMSVVKSLDDEARVVHHLEVYYGLFMAYFNELASTTQVDVSGPPPDPAGTTVWGAQRAARLGSKRSDAP